MTDVPISRFACPDCGSVYKVVRLKTPPEPHDHPVGCLTCGRALARVKTDFCSNISGLRDPPTPGAEGRNAPTLATSSPGGGREITFGKVFNAHFREP